MKCERCGEANPAEIHTCTPQEPVAWMYNGNLHEFDPSDWAEGEVIPLYTASPKREWQDLTEEEEDEIWDECLGIGDCLKMTQAKLKEKNT